MNRPTKDDVRSFYDARIEGKLQDFTHANPRIESAIATIDHWAPTHPKRVLEIGCGIGATSWRMARAWPNAEVIGVDISEESIRVAQSCFQLPNLRYQSGLVTPESLHGKFDFIVLMDVYEHIAIEERALLHASISAHTESLCRVLLTFPTPATQARGRRDIPDAMQPIDEDVTPQDILVMASDLEMQLLYYRQVAIWRLGDYAHAVVGRFSQLADAEPSQPVHSQWSKFKQRLKSIAGRSAWTGERLGVSLLSSQCTRSKFEVSMRERLELARKWRESNEPK